MRFDRSEIEPPIGQRSGLGLRAKAQRVEVAPPERTSVSLARGSTFVPRSGRSWIAATSYLTDEAPDGSRCLNGRGLEQEVRCLELDEPCRRQEP